MSGPFKIGDVVVCLHLEPLGTWFDDSLSRLKARGVYRVSSVDDIGDIIPDGIASGHPSGHWWRGRFAHLPKADEQFTASMRACKPVRVGEPA